jgi:hypothetical protein
VKIKEDKENKKKKKKIVGATPKIGMSHVLPRNEEDIKTILTISRKVIFTHHARFHVLPKCGN